MDSRLAIVRLPRVLFAHLAFVAFVLAAFDAGAQAPALAPASSAQILQEVRTSGARAVLVNLWATWCHPCREEMPDLVRLARDYEGSGFRLILVSGDFPEEAESARKFLADLGFESRSFLKNEADMTFIDGLSPRWTGALPASFLYDGNGKLVDFWERKASYGEIRDKVLPLLARDAPPETKRG